MAQISVLMPIYNTIEYLRRSIDSVLAQTFTDFELLLIDDGSTDGCDLICEEYAADDKRIKIIHTQHIGVSSARNLGLELAKGKYIMFCDSDDFVEPDWIKTLYEAAIQNPNSLISCEYASVNPTNGYKKIRKYPNATCEMHIPKSDYYLMAKSICVSHLWSRIFKADIIKNNKLKFVDYVNQGEDVLFIINYLQYCEDFYYIPKCLYYWADNNVETLSRKFYPHYYDDLKALYVARKTIIDEKYLQDFYDEYYHRFFSV